MKWCIHNDWYKGCNVSRENDIGDYSPENCTIKSASLNRAEQDNTINYKQVVLFKNDEEKVFSNTKLAAEFLGTSHDSVGAVARGNEQTIKGYKAKYIGGIYEQTE